MKKICMRFVVWSLRVLSLFFKPWKLKQKVLLISRQSNEKSLDFDLLEKELKEREIETIVLCHEMKISVIGILQYIVHIFIQMRHIADSAVVIVDGYCMAVSVVDKKQGQKAVQIWHSLAAIKKFGWQSVGTIDGRSHQMAKIMKMHQNYDYFIAPSEVTADLFAEAFHMDKEKGVLLGLPRIDAIKRSSEATRKNIIEVYPEAAQKENILYAPTFRKGKALELDDLIYFFPFESYNLIIKKHPLDSADYAEASAKGAIFDQSFTTIEWFSLCQKVITDYSGVAIEAAVAGKELFFYLPDRDCYTENLGLNMHFEEESIKEYVCSDAEKLCKLMAAEYDAETLRKFTKKYVSVSTDKCTEDMCDFIEELLNGCA